MRLGDLDALKEDLKKTYGITRDSWKTVEKVIDNAPTVKTYCYFCGQTEHGKMEERRINNERPQGEWELIANDTVNLEYIYKCSECGREVRVYNASALTDIYPFCHCGADMRKRGVENG